MGAWQQEKMQLELLFNEQGNMGFWKQDMM